LFPSDRYSELILSCEVLIESDISKHEFCTMNSEQ